MKHLRVNVMKSVRARHRMRAYGIDVFSAEVVEDARRSPSYFF